MEKKNISQDTIIIDVKSLKIDKDAISDYMIKDIKKPTTSISLVDYIGRIEDGVAVILSLELNRQIYELMYWFNSGSKKRVTIEEKFYHHYPEVRDIMEYEYLIDLLYHVDTEILPDKKDIFKEFF